MFSGHRYGNTLVPMTEDDKANMKYKAEKCFKVLGFTKAENVSTCYWESFWRQSIKMTKLQTIIVDLVNKTT